MCILGELPGILPFPLSPISQLKSYSSCIVVPFQ